MAILPLTERNHCFISINGHYRQRILEHKAKKPIHTLFRTQPFNPTLQALLPGTFSPRFPRGHFCSISTHSIMPDTAGLDSSKLATPRSPASISTESSRRGSFKPAQIPARDPGPSRASSPPARLTRKRAAILNTERTNLSQDIGDLALSTANTAVSTSSDLTREQVCLCQPDPKIPRPRNGIQYTLFPHSLPYLIALPLSLYSTPKKAQPGCVANKLICIAFILYRQHYQAQVIAQNPGLANPEISKIIGEQWRDQAPEIKNDWKRLAEVYQTSTYLQHQLILMVKRKRSKGIDDSILGIDTSLGGQANRLAYARSLHQASLTILDVAQSATGDISLLQVHH